jgi:hypothetical protein
MVLQDLDPDFTAGVARQGLDDLDVLGAFGPLR